ncbi:pentatricopeptide repeat-containing protein At5g66520-like [Tasmannia lanceolata]|uniref:pentatricopeptide repeat-containing protein At5g66520-like n=1 Tax=Tasmannia lanceolata TaxID=3420 RepID=UPI004063E06D
MYRHFLPSFFPKIPNFYTLPNPNPLPKIPNLCTLPNPSLLSKILAFLDNSCSSMSDLKKIHALFIVSGSINETLIASRLIRFCALSPFGSFDYSLLIYTHLNSPNPFICNTIIKSYINQSRPSDAILFLCRSSRAAANEYTFPLLLNAAAHLNRIHQDLARQVFDEMSQRDTVSYNSMIDGYVKSGDLDAASGLFWETPVRNSVTWNTLLSGYVQNCRFGKGLGLFRQMMECGFKPDDSTFVSSLSAAAHLKAVLYGKSIHGFLVKYWVCMPAHVSTALIDFYCKCGGLRVAVTLFGQMPQRDLICWNALIAGLAGKDKGKAAIGVFSLMLNEGIKPDDITFLGVLTGCAHSGLVDEGLRHFEMMSSVFNIKPRFAHYWCLVDLYMRVGNPDEAFKIIMDMPLGDQSSIWGALIGIARVYGDIDVGEYLGKRLIELEPYNSNRYLPLMNIYAAAQKWDKYKEMRELMKERRFKKPPDCTLIDLNNVAHEFSIGDRLQPEIEKIYSALEVWAKNLNLQPRGTDEVLSI